MRCIFEEFATVRSAQLIAQSLNKDRIRAPNGGSWDGSMIRGNPSRREGIPRNQHYIGIASICQFTLTYHQETGQRKLKATPEDCVKQEIPELRIKDQVLWDAVQTKLARRAADTPKAARAARRNVFLLSGLLKCGCCGAPYVTINKTSYRCREARRAACKNKRPISRRRIEARVFGALRAAFRSDDLLKRFEQALEDERGKLADGQLEADLKRFETARDRATAGLDNTLAAFAEGARKLSRLKPRRTLWSKRSAI